MTSNNANAEHGGININVNKQIRIPQQDIYREDKFAHMDLQSNFEHADTFNNQKPMQQTPAQMTPPKYQPPPQPQGGILKNLNSKKRKTLGASDSAQLIMKYPPELQKNPLPGPNDTVQSSIPIITRGPPKTAPPKIPQFNRPPMVAPNPPKPEPPPPTNNIILPPQTDETKAQGNFHHTYIQDGLRSQKTEIEMAHLKGHSGNSPSSEAVSRLPHPQNKHFQALVAELRATKEANQRLSDDNQELRDLCCFLDDDRQKGRKLAREWQRFGRYTASVMRQEVSAYQNKLRQLDDKQQELIRDNLELKELCLYLDEERSNRNTNPVACRNCGVNVRPVRDDGDGSSFGTNEDQLQSEINQQSILTYQTLQYVRFLEQRINQLELETGASNNAQGNFENDLSSGRPEAVIRALQILEVREQLENDRTGGTPFLDHMDDGEKALVREMCNVVWKKLEENPNDPRMDPL